MLIFLLLMSSIAYKKKCMTKKFTFAVSNRQKFIANLCTQPMHFREDFGEYKTKKVMNVNVFIVDIFIT